MKSLARANLAKVGVEGSNPFARSRNFSDLEAALGRLFRSGGNGLRRLYTAGCNISGFRDGLASAGGCLSAASFLGISVLVFASRQNRLICSIGCLVGWPITTFLVAERLGDLDRFTFADAARYQLHQRPVWMLAAAAGRLTVVAFHLLAQMVVGAGPLIELLFGREYTCAVTLIGPPMILDVMFGGVLATTWFPIIKAVLLLGGAAAIAFMVTLAFGVSFEALPTPG